MTNQQQPIVPPPDLMEQWHSNSPLDRGLTLATQAAQWGADQELEACCEWLIGWDTCEGERLASLLHEGRRPKPPSLKEQALAALRHAPGPDYPNAITLLTADEHALIRRALEQLND